VGLPFTVVISRYDKLPGNRKVGQHPRNAAIDRLLRRYYSNSTTFTLHIDENQTVHTLVHKAGMPAKMSEILKKYDTVAALADGCHKLAGEIQQNHASAMAAAQVISDAGEKAKQIEEAEKLKEPAELKELRDKLAEIQEKGIYQYIWNRYLSDFEPSFLYFDEYYQMTGEVNVDTLKQRIAAKKLLDSDRPMHLDWLAN
jgi:hypothetical protein